MQDMKRTLRQNILMAVLGRVVLVLTNLALAGIIISILKELTALLMTPENDIREMIEMCNGIAIILYGYGVSLELRVPFMKLIEVYPACATPLSRWVDRVCYKYGIFFILLGLVQEILVHIVLIPNIILNTEGKESHIFIVCALMQVIVAVLLVLMSYRLAMATHLAERDGAIDGGEETGYA